MGTPDGSGVGRPEGGGVGLNVGSGVAVGTGVGANVGWWDGPMVLSQAAWPVVRAHCPWTQAVHVAAPTLPAKVPAGQGVQLVAPLDENLPAAHGRPV